MKRNPATRKKEAGQALIAAVAGLGVVLMGFAGLGVDMGYLRYQKRLQQTAADSAAIAGAAELPYSTSGYVAAAQHDAASNGFTDGANNVTVTVNSPPTSGPHNGVAGYVEVTVAQVQPTFFMRILKINNETVTARAVANSNGNSSGGGCLYTLGTGTDISLNGNDTINGPSCGIVDDGGLSANGNNTISARSIGLAGAYSKNGNNNINPAPVTGIVKAADPLAYLTPPSTGGNCIANPNLNGNGNTTLNPGNYCNGISINGNINVTFNPGVYILGNSLSSNGNGTLTGNGVMFYQTGGTITLNGNNTVNFNAPTSSGGGAIAGILFWQAASDTSSPTFNGNNGSTLSGVLYYPGAQVNMNGNNGAAAYTIIVAQSVTMNGNNTLTLSNDTSSLTGGSPIKNAVLVE